MKAKLFYIVSGMLLAVFLFTAVGSVLAGDKITICHVPPGNPANAQTISVDRNAWENGHDPHNKHNMDYVGPCQAPAQPTSTATQRPTNVPPTNVPPTNPPPATETDEPIIPTETDEPIIPTETDEPIIPTETDEPIIPTATRTPNQPTATQTPNQPTATRTPNQPTRTPGVVPTATATAVATQISGYIQEKQYLQEWHWYLWESNLLNTLDYEATMTVKYYINGSLVRELTDTQPADKWLRVTLDPSEIIVSSGKFHVMVVIILEDEIIKITEEVNWYQP